MNIKSKNLKSEKKYIYFKNHETEILLLINIMVIALYEFIYLKY